MSIEVKCPECQALLRIAEEHAGRQARCPSCKAVFTPASTTPASSTPVSRSTDSPLGGTAGPFGAAPRAAVDAPNPYHAPNVTAPDVRMGSSGLSSRLITPEEVFSKSWAIFKDQWLMACAAVLIVGAINFVLSAVQNGVMQVINANANDQVIAVASQIFISFGGWLIQIWLQIGQTMVMLDIARGREIKLGKVFSGGYLLPKTVFAMIMVTLIIASIFFVLAGLPAAVVGLAMQDQNAALTAGLIGFVIAIAPIVVVSLMLSQIQVLIVDRGVGAVESLRLSREITNGNKLTFFLIGILLAMIGFAAVIVGLLALCVGIFPAMIGVGGFAGVVIVVAYLCMTGQHVAVPAAQFSQPA